MTRERVVVASAAVSLGIIAQVWVFLPPFPVPGWIVGALAAAPFETWRYQADLSPELASWFYRVGNVVSVVIYPSLVAVAFGLWTRPLARGTIMSLRRSLAPLWLGGPLSAAWYAIAWRDAVIHQGYFLIGTSILVSALALAAATGLVVMGVKMKSWRASIFGQWLFFAWAVAVGFPWLGEMI